MPYNELSIERRIKTTFPKIEKNIYIKLYDLSATAWITREPVTFSERFSGIKRNLQPGDNWGDLFDCAWFNFKGILPEGANDLNTVLIIDISGEAYVVDESGIPLQGITTVASMYDFSLGFPGKKVVYLNNLIKDNNMTIDIWADAGNNDLFGNQKNNGTLIEAYIASLSVTMRDLYYDFEVLNELRIKIPKNKSQYQKITSALYKASLELKDFTPGEAAKAREHLKIELNRKNIDYPLSISAVGHSHIDLAWLWPIRETIRKGARTFATALLNIERYPEYIFGASQPQLYHWIKEFYPELFNKIKIAVAQGRWELQGAMWVESDTNITGGESLIRQMLYGKNFFLKEFGHEVKSLWLPDVFGYTAALPQIIKKSGADYFMTIKISWSEFNEFPHHTFKWIGIDGSEVLAHMPPEGTYNSSAAPRAIIDAEEKFKDKAICDECLMLFGIGDGGGGPGEEHLERLKRESNIQGLAPVKQEFSSSFFERINKDKAIYKSWRGELYLEHHRGTYTSEGRNKKYNKLLENLLRDVEIISFINNSEYPQKLTEQIWKEVLLYQFHDILPGSSIKRVYDESLERYQILQNNTMDILNKTAGCDLNCTETYKVYNTLSWDRNEWVKAGNNWYKRIIPALSSIIIDSSYAMDKFASPEINEKDNIMENEFLKIKFDENGFLDSIFDKTNSREIVKNGFSANTLAVYRDEGDAWDFPHDYKDYVNIMPVLVNFEYYNSGPDAIRKNIYRYKNSIIEQEIVVRENSSKIDIKTRLDWKDADSMLRAGIPISIQNDKINCGIQFGYIDRPTYKNTKWDMAKLEICCQNYADISNRDYGVSVLSDYKYGYSAEPDVIEINLLRSTSYPDVSGDLGIHEFTYSIYPHKGDHIDGDVIKKGFELSRPLRMFSVKRGSSVSDESFVKCSCENIFIETIKKAENGDGLIVRLYEAYGIQTNTSVVFSSEYTLINETNLIEQFAEDLGKHKNNVNLFFTPFEIKTIHLSRE